MNTATCLTPGHSLAHLSDPEPQRYRVEFTATEEYVELVEQAKALLGRSSPRAGLEEIHLRAMRALVAELEKQKYAVTSRARRPASHDPASHDPASHDPASHDPDDEPTPDPKRAPCPKPEPGVVEEAPPATRQRGRTIPSAIRRAVFERDARRCTYLGARGERCRETCGLELHHIKAYALGGEHSEANLTLRCRAHNALAAEQELGRDLVERKRHSLGHEPFAAQARRESGG